MITLDQFLTLSAEERAKVSAEDMAALRAESDRRMKEARSDLQRSYDALAIQTAFEEKLTREAQADGRFPLGFYPVFFYPDGKGESAKIRPGALRIAASAAQSREDLEFSVESFAPESLPVLPLKGHGEIWSVGWDIPTRWAIDGAGVA